MNAKNDTSETGCCPRFNPEAWDEKEVTWTEKLFVKDQVRSFLHMCFLHDLPEVRQSLWQELRGSPGRGMKPRRSDGGGISHGYQLYQYGIRYVSLATSWQSPLSRCVEMC